jgi:glycosyltransferase involved in cell wall biosynthesis
MNNKGFKKIKIEDNDKQTENQNIIYNYLLDKNINKITTIFIIIIIVLILFFYLKSLYNKNNQDIYKEYALLTEEIQKYEKTLRDITPKEIEEFRTINSLGILYDRIKYKRSENPDITIVTTMYNQAHCITKAIRSIQNQSLKNIEIIIIDDCSLDNSTETVEELMKEDDRITLIRHNEINEGIMITRNEGIRMAKGKYITILDADDTLIHKDILKYSLYVANLADLDIVEFWTAYYEQKKFIGYFHFHGYHPIIIQPELKTKFIEFSDEEYKRAIQCRTVWGKIIRNEIFQKTLDNIPEKYLYDYILGFEDTMITVSLYQIAQSYYCLRQPGYYYTFDEKGNQFPLIKKKQCKRKENADASLDHVKFMQFLVDKLDDDKVGKQILYHEIKAINNFTYSNFKRTITHHFDWVYSIFDKLIDSKDITEKQRENLQKIKNEIKENEKKQKKKSNIKL